MRCTRKLKCWLIGHAIDPTICQGWYPCMRCEETFEDPPRDDVWMYLLWYDATRWFRLSRFRAWLRCPICKCRFGRHDQSRCIPF